jgi:hypothetical protein
VVSLSRRRTDTADETCTANDGAASITSNRAPFPTFPAFTNNTRQRLGVISLSSSSHRVLNAGSRFIKPVALRPGRAGLATHRWRPGLQDLRRGIGIVPVTPSNSCTSGVLPLSSTSGLCQKAQGESAAVGQISLTKAHLDPNVTTKLLEPLSQ